MCDKMAISAYILIIVEKDQFLRLQMRAKEMFRPGFLWVVEGQLDRVIQVDFGLLYEDFWLPNFEFKRSLLSLLNCALETLAGVITTLLTTQLNEIIQTKFLPNRHAMLLLKGRKVFNF